MGPVNDANYVTVNTSLFLSVSRKFVIFSFELAGVIAEARPLDIPPDDHFEKVVSVHDPNDCCYCFASLKKHPWVYLFGSMAEVLDTYDLTGYIPDNDESSTFEISDLVAMYADDMLLLYVLGTGKPYFFIINVFGPGNIEVKVVSFNGSDSPIANVLADPAVLRILVYDQDNVLRLCYLDGTELETKAFSWPKVVTNQAISDIGRFRHYMIFGCENGQVCVLLAVKPRCHCLLIDVGVAAILNLGEINPFLNHSVFKTTNFISVNIMPLNKHL